MAPNEVPATAPPPGMSLYVWWLIFLLSLIWGGSFFFGRIAVQEVPPLTTVLVRVMLAALTLNLVLLFMGAGKLRQERLWRKFAIMGLLNNIIPFSLIFYGQTEIGAGLAAIINAMTPIWTALLAHVRTDDEKLSPGKLFGILCGFAGVAIMIGAAALAGLASAAIAQIAVLGATISYAFAGVYGRTFKDIPPVETARGQLTMSSLFMIPLAFVFDKPWTLPVPSMETVVSLLLLAILCTAFAYILFFRILASAGATNVALVTFLVPVSAIFLGILFLGETLQTRHFAGIALIATGLIFIDGRLFKKS